MGSYSHYQEYRSKNILAQPIEDKVYFAGEAFAPNKDLATVHGVGRSAYIAIEKILENKKN